MKSIYILCGEENVREENQELNEYIKKLKSEGNEVSTEYQGILDPQVCKEKVTLIKNVDEVHVFCLEKYQEVLFGLGVVFALGKPLVVVYAPESILTTLLDWEEKNKFSPMTSVVGNPHILQFKNNSIALTLIKKHLEKKIESEEDLNDIRKHCDVTLDFARETIGNVEGTSHEKVLKLSEVKEELKNFKFSKNDE